MPRIFGRTATTLLRAAPPLLAAALVLLFVLVQGWIRMPGWQDAARPAVQPVPFSHAHHVGVLGLDCRYCHASVETSTFAGLPATSTCMNCHSQLWTESPLLEPVRTSLRTGTPIEWVRIHDLPDYVYFDHRAHVRAGVSCVRCHGRVDRMPRIEQVHALTMGWCLECHRRPQDGRVAAGRVFDPAALAGDMTDAPPIEVSADLLTRCNTCHR